MEVIDTTDGLAKALRAATAPASSAPAGPAPAVGFVPTMGALHAGHLSLVAAARAQCATVVVSVFVNPLQFGPGEDLASYPRDLDGDCAQARDAGADIVFAPSPAQMYPDAATAGTGPWSSERAARLGDVLEGASRPGHLAGVARAVTRLFDLVGPCRAYFGEKDYQQLLVVRQLVADLAIPAEIVACPTVRAPDGLALSSRNGRLAPHERVAASVLYRALVVGRAAIEAGETAPGSVEGAMVATVRAEALASLDYVAVVVAADLAPATAPLRGELRLLVAARVGAVRLVDNLGVRAR